MANPVQQNIVLDEQAADFGYVAVDSDIVAAIAAARNHFVAQMVPVAFAVTVPYPF